MKCYEVGRVKWVLQYRNVPCQERVRSGGSVKIDRDRERERDFERQKKIYPKGGRATPLQDSG